MVLTYSKLTWEEYNALFDFILKGKSDNEMYKNEEYLNYVKLNKSRMNRWIKSLTITDSLEKKVQAISSAQKWILITEPWCGDAAHNVPFIYKLAQLNPLISIEFVLRDKNTEFMDNYLTNGGRSIPKLIVRDTNDHDLFTWGPRPVQAQELLARLKAENADLPTVMNELQQWYNSDKGQLLMQEIESLLETNIQ